MKVFFFLVFVLMSVAFFTLIERKVLSLLGLRVGPRKVSIMGFLQPIVDAAKLMNKSGNSLSNSSFFFYSLSSGLLLFCFLLSWVLFVSEGSIINLKNSSLIFLILLSLGCLSSILCGWSSSGKFPLIGSLRSLAQMISYEGPLFFCFFFFFVIFSSHCFSCLFFFEPFFCFFFLFLIFWFPSFLAELNRSPFDFSEGESELVSGFNTDFGSQGFTFIFLSEYGNMIFFCFISSLLFFFGLSLSFVLLFLSLIWIRGFVPRFRFDKLMNFCWLFLVPLVTLFYFFFLDNLCFL